MIYTAELFGTPKRTVMDPVHGSIPVFRHELKIIDEKLFQRLRHVLQNDVLFLVFPGSTHSRFLHSIGTMHMVSKLFVKITSSYLRDNQLITEEQKKSIQYIHCCLRLAGLLHDTGHCPFSHQFEHAVGNILTPSLFEKLWGSTDYNKFYIKPVTEIFHEHFSVRIAHEILSTNKSFKESGILLEDVLFFLETTEHEASPELLNHCKNFVQIFFPTQFGLPIVAESVPKVLKSFLKFLKTFVSGELDADKMDYILRDSYFSGCRYGNYNKDHLINSLRVGWELFYVDENNSNPNQRVHDVQFSLAVLEKGLGALEDFVYARYQLYLELYNHKTVSGLRKLLSLALTEILSLEENKLEVENILCDLESFSNFSDTFFWEKFRNFSQKEPHSACKRLIDRHKLPYVGKRVNENEDEVDLLCDRLSTTRKITIKPWKSHVKFSKINSAFINIKVLVKPDDGGKRKLKKISKVTDFFDKFEKKDIFHLFEIPKEIKSK